MPQDDFLLSLYIRFGLSLLSFFATGKIQTRRFLSACGYAQAGTPQTCIFLSPPLRSFMKVAADSEGIGLRLLQKMSFGSRTNLQASKLRKNFFIFFHRLQNFTNVV